MKRFIVTFLAVVALVSMMCCSKKCDYLYQGIEVCYDTAGGHTEAGVAKASTVSYNSYGLEGACIAVSGTVSFGTCE